MRPARNSRKVSRLAGRSDVERRPFRAPLQPRNRKRWLAVIGIAVLWALFVHSTGSVTGGTILLALLAAAVIGLVVALRYLGINSGHPWAQYLAGRPWRDGRDVLRLGLRQLPGVLIITPGGSLLAPNAIELRMNPRDLASLTEVMDIGLVNSSATEVYESQITAHSAGLASAGPVEVSVIGDPAVPVGRYRLRQGRPAGPPRPAGPWPPAGPQQPAGSLQPAGPWPPAGPSQPAGPWQPARPVQPAGRVSALAREGRTHVDLAAARTVVTDSARDSVTVTALAAVPLLRLATNGSVAETRISGARAGRSRETELRLPEELTVSRVHAEFTFTDGRWHIANQGLNGVTLNGTPLTGQHAIRDGDSIGWGTQPGALVSRVEIGWDKALPAHGQR
jgi:FHA domain